ncbi:MAG: hypothetical protein ABR520_10560, partial [Mycobacteriales bacterium]|nr:hypothetical protein [Frankia sp.]
MFVQIITGKISDKAALRARFDDWEQNVGPGAIGALGSTTGVTPDGTGVIVGRFDTPENARRNNDRPEQGAWWAETEKVFTGPVTFWDSDDADVAFGNPSDDAGFVQLMHYTVTDRARLEALEKEMTAEIESARPDVLGGLRAWHNDGTVTEVIYFTSEAEARAGEKKELPPEAAEAMQNYMELAQDTTY